MSDGGKAGQADGLAPGGLLLLFSGLANVKPSGVSSKTTKTI